jgi:threonine aldolase
VVQTNIVIFGLSNSNIASADIVRRLAAEGVKMNAISPTQCRAVTHYGIERDDIDAALITFRKVMGALA